LKLLFTWLFSHPRLGSFPERFIKDFRRTIEILPSLTDKCNTMGLLEMPLAKISLPKVYCYKGFRKKIIAKFNSMHVFTNDKKVVLAIDPIISR
jgi:hypothetical protein